MTREDGTLSADACSAFGAPATLIGTPAQSGLATGCYRYVLTGTDNVGNTVTLTTVVKVDTSAPSAPTLSFASATGGAYYSGSGSTVFFRPAAGVGQFDVTASSTDADTNVASYTFPAAPVPFGTSWSVAGAGATRTYSYAVGAAEPGSQNVSATNGAGTVSGTTPFTSPRTRRLPRAAR